MGVEAAETEAAENRAAAMSAVGPQLHHGRQQSLPLRRSRQRQRRPQEQYSEVILSLLFVTSFFLLHNLRAFTRWV